MFRKNKKLWVLALLFFNPQSIFADRYDDLMTSWMGRFKSSSIGWCNSTDAMRMAWDCASAFYGACYAYEVTKDPVLITTMYNLLEDNLVGGTRKNPLGMDGYLITSADGTFKNTDATWWTDGVEYSGESFRIILGILHWVYFVKSTPSLPGQYLTKANQYLDKMENNLVKKWLDNWWIDDTKDTPSDFHYPGASMLVQPTCTTHTTNPYARYLMSSANNKHSDFGLAMIMLYKITGNQKYQDIVRSTALDFKSKLIWQNNGEYYSWHYQDPFWDWDFVNKVLGGLPRHGVWIEHRSGYGGIDMKFMTECYRMGIVFNKLDIARFVKTNVEIMYNGGNWLKNDGSPPNTAASESAGPYEALAPYDGSSLLANLLYNGYNSNISSYDARCGAPYLVYIMKIPAAELNPPDTMKWVGPLEAIDLEVINRGAIKLTFYNEVDPTSVSDIANWAFSRGMECIGAETDPVDKHKVIVYSTEQVPEVAMKIRVRNVRDVLGNVTFAYPYSNQPYEWVSSTVPASIPNPELKLPAAQTFLRVGPNPARDEVRVRYLANRNEEPVTLRIFNSKGEIIYSATSPRPRHGENTLVWNRRTARHQRIPAGLYIVGISNLEKSILGKVLLTK